MVKRHYQVVIIYVCIVLLVFVSSMILGIVTNKKGSFQGKIIVNIMDSDSSALEGAQIKIQNHPGTYRSDKKGQIIRVIPDLLPGDTLHVEVNKNDYRLLSSFPRFLVVKKGQEEYEQTFIMQKIPLETGECMLAIKTVDANGNSVSGVQVKILRSPVTYYTDYTDNAGQVIQSLFNPLIGETIHVEVNKNGYELVSSSPRHLVIREGQNRYEQTHVLQRVTPKPTPRYVVEFSFQDETGAQIPGVSVHRNNVHIGESDQRGTFRDTLESLSSSNRYSFRKQYYWQSSWDMSNYPVSQTSYQRTITMERLLVSLRCVDITGIHKDNLDSIRISEIGGRNLAFTDINGMCMNILLPVALTKLRFQKEDIFPPQDREIRAERDRVTEVILNPREGSLTVTVMTQDRSIVPGVEVTMEGNGFSGSKKTNEYGEVRFTDPRIMPGMQFWVQVGSEKQSTWTDQWDTKRDFFLLNK